MTMFIDILSTSLVAGASFKTYLRMTGYLRISPDTPDDIRARGPLLQALRVCASYCIYIFTN